MKKEGIGYRVRGFLDAVGVTQQAVAVELQRDEGGVSRLLTGARQADPWQMFRIGYATGKIVNSRKEKRACVS